MIRALATLLVAGLLLSACGSISATKAMASWVAESNYHKTAKLLVSDASHSVTALKNVHSTRNQLHTVCAVLDYDTVTANASLPTPDNQATNLLASAYNRLGDGANLCYQSAGDAATRARAISDLARAVGTLAEASTRIASATTP